MTRPTPAGVQPPADVRRQTVEWCCNPDVLTLYLLDKDVWVREAVARNPYATTPLLTVLAEDLEWVVRKAAVLHPFCPPEIVVWCSQTDRSEQVRDAAARRLAFEREQLSRGQTSS